MNIAGMEKIKKEYVSRLVAALLRKGSVLAAYLHGSILNETFREESDIDCALLLHAPCSLSDVEQLHWAGQLSGVVGRRIDLGIISTHNLVYAMQAISKGELLFCRNAVEKDRVVMRLYSLYAKLREDRAEVEQAYGCG